MHSVNRPSDEANRLYIDQSGLAQRLLPRGGHSDELVIWDVGLGAASNAMAVVNCFENVFRDSDAAMRSLRMISFECDLDPLRLASKFASHFPHLRHGAPHAILEKGSWLHPSGLMSWELIEGDFLQLFEAVVVPDLIFYDPFSAKTDTGLWTAAVFGRIAAHCHSKSAELYTYSAATAVRVSLLTAGFFVAAGVGTGPKADTTLAFTRGDRSGTHPAKPKLLDSEWLGRWRRSDSKYPRNLAGTERPAFEAMIEGHPQFRARVR